ncbi:ABC transporter permease [Paracoccus zhejiangensis]|uniref:ABC transporter permease n=2 Tax=Paracoccus zhejiangensis TaxID=1077935 RepID=A0A2H5F0D7_9RHOB|nr:ABC transporter permease subunit [Paracoccus zhejiangensis]AUH65019.1 ABC transporter permease [Paracoccus zhejiangensis]
MALPGRRAAPALRTLGGAAILLLAWELAAQLLGGAYLLAGPVEVARWLAENPGLTGRALAVTLWNGAAGFALGNLAAILLAGAALTWPRSQPVITGLSLLVFCLPLVATGPILRVLMGPGNGPQIALAALAVFYTTLIPLLVGLRAAPAVWFDLLRSYGRGRMAELRHIRARSALPYLFAGLQIAAPAAFLGAMVGEFTGAERGLGVLTIRFLRALDVPGLWAVCAVAATVSILAYAAIGALARAMLREPPPLILSLPSTEHAPSALVSTALVAALALLIWWGGMETFSLNPFFAKRPDDVLDALLMAPDATETRARLWAALSETTIFLLPGYLAGLVIGAALAMAVTLLPAAGALVLPLAVALRSVPIVATAPLIVLLLGRGALGTITLVGVMVFFPTFVACLHGLKQTPGQIRDVFDCFAASRLRRLVDLQIPAMLPAFFAAARMAVPAAVLAVTVVEWLATGRGIGSLMALSASLSDYDMLWSCVLVVAVLSALGFAAIAGIERRLLARLAPEQVRR